MVEETARMYREEGAEDIVLGLGYALNDLGCGEC